MMFYFNNTFRTSKIVIKRGTKRILDECNPRFQNVPITLSVRDKLIIRISHKITTTNSNFSVCLIHMFWEDTNSTITCTPSTSQSSDIIVY